MQVWLCVPAWFLSPACPIKPSDLACHVFNELNQTFAFWGPNSQLRMVPQPSLQQNNSAAQPGMTPIAQTCDGTFALGKCWKAFQAWATWQDAETACVAWGGHLASITSASEQAYAANTSVDVYTWIGFHDPVGSHSTADWSNFAWSDGSPGGMSGYAGWCRNPNGENVEPNNAGSENCATLYPRSTSGSRCWNDHPCSNGGVIGSYLCKR